MSRPSRYLPALALVLVSMSSLACSASEEEGSGDSVTLTGKVGGGSVTPQAFGSVAVERGGVHVVARQLHRSGERGATIDTTASADGSFHVELARNARYVVTIDDATANSAMVVFGDGRSVLSVSAEAQAGRVDIGSLSVQGGQARSNIVLRWAGLASALPDLGEVFVAADGAILEAQQALEAARRAAEEAYAAAEAARQAANQAQQAADEARQAAGY